MTTLQPPPIGGYFEFELSQGEGEYHPCALRYQSARAAFLALLRAGHPDAIWLPWYICDSMVEAATMGGIPVRRYQLDKQLRVLDANLGARDWLLYVNYFGVCAANVSATLARFDPAKVIIDNSQAFYDKPHDCLASIYSPRKFFGVPDGGYLITQLAVPAPEKIDKGSLKRCQHLLQRLEHGPEPGYSSFVQAESSLSGQEPRRMSTLTQTLLGRIPYLEIREKRRANFCQLHAHLAASNQFPLSLQGREVPLCYPYLAPEPYATRTLYSQRIYLPCYWPEVVSPVFESGLAKSVLFLPCDQRMTSTLTDRLLSVLAQECKPGTQP